MRAVVDAEAAGIEGEASERDLLRVRQVAGFAVACAACGARDRESGESAKEKKSAERLVHRDSQPL